jgi:phenylalanyl-tRNA synthetase alpha chain
MKNKWLQPEKQDGAVVVARKTAAITDSVQVELQALAAGKTLPDDVTANLVKRTLVQKQYLTLCRTVPKLAFIGWRCRVVKSMNLSRGRKFTTKLEKLETELTQQMLLDGSWQVLPPFSFLSRKSSLIFVLWGCLQTKKFKPVQLNALGVPLEPGHLHPLLKVLSLRCCYCGFNCFKLPTFCDFFADDKTSWGF